MNINDNNIDNISQNKNDIIISNINYKRIFNYKNKENKKKYNKRKKVIAKEYYKEPYIH